MSIDPLTAALELGKTILERIIPDPTQRAKALLELEELAQKKDLATLQAKVQLMLAQIDVNKTEATSKSIFVAGWRPFIGWTGGFAMAYQFILYPLLIWIWAIFQASGVIPAEVLPPPIIDTDALWIILTGLLGIGGYRSLDKYNKVQTDKLD